MNALADELFDALDAILGAASRETDLSIGDAGLWTSLEENGYTSIDPRDPDVGLAEFLAIARVVGKHALALPLVESGLAAWAAAAVDLKLPDGVVLASTTDHTLQVEHDAGALVVSGRLPRVPWGRRADHVLALGEDSEHRYLLLVAPEEIIQGANLAGEPRDEVVVDAQRITDPSYVPAGALTLEELRLRAAVLRGAQASGAMEAVLDLAVEYAGQREQFGAPIASFQAVQQHLVTIASGTAATRAGVESVVRSGPSSRRLAAAAAKVTSDSRTTSLARSAHQVFGAIGVTEEHSLHRWTRRLWSWQEECGTAAEWSRFLTRRLVFDDGPGLWAVLTPPHPALEARDLAEAVSW